MRRRVWTHALRRKTVFAATLILVFAVFATVVSFTIPVGDLAFFSTIFIAAVAAALIALAARGWYEKRMEGWVRKQADDFGVSFVYVRPFLNVMWSQTFEISRGTPSLMVCLATAKERMAILPKNVSIPGLFERKAQAILSSGVWDEVMGDGLGNEMVEAVIVYPQDDAPEDLRELFDMAGASQAIAYLKITRNSRTALDAVRSGIPAEYLSAAQ